MTFTERPSALGIKRLAFQILMANGTFKALRVVIVVEGLDPSVARFDRISAAHTFGREQFVPVLLTEWLPVFQVERIVAKCALAVTARKALWMPLLVQRQ